MYPSTTVAVGSGGTLAFTGLALGGYLWAGLILLVLGLIITGAAAGRDARRRRRSRIRT